MVREAMERQWKGKAGKPQFLRNITAIFPFTKRFWMEIPFFSPLKKKVGKKGGSPIFPIQSYCSGKLLPINSNYCSIQSQ